MLVFDFISMGIDIADAQGYNNYTENAIIANAIQQAQFNMEQVAHQEESEYPMTFPLSMAFGEKWETAVNTVIAEDYEVLVLDKVDTEYPHAAEELAEAFAQNEDAEVPESFMEAYAILLDRELGEDPKARDARIYEELLKLLSKEERSMSNSNRLSRQNVGTASLYPGRGDMVERQEQGVMV